MLEHIFNIIVYFNMQQDVMIKPQIIIHIIQKK
jgi:hypothetical protein